MTSSGVSKTRLLAPLLALVVLGSACGSTESVLDDAAPQSDASSGAVLGNDASGGDADAGEQSSTAEPAPAQVDADNVYDIASPSLQIAIADVSTKDRGVHFSLSPTGDRLAVVSWDFNGVEPNGYALYDTATGEELATAVPTWAPASLAWTSDDTLAGFVNGGFEVYDPTTFEQILAIPGRDRCLLSHDNTVFDYASNAFYAVNRTVACRVDAATGEQLWWDWELGAAVTDYESGSTDSWRAMVPAGGDRVVFRTAFESGVYEEVTLDGTTLELISREPIEIEDQSYLVSDTTRVIETGPLTIGIETAPGSDVIAEVYSERGEGVSPGGRYFSLIMKFDPETGEAEAVSGRAGRLLLDAVSGEPALALIMSEQFEGNWDRASAWAGDESTYAVRTDTGVDIYNLAG